MKICDLWDVFFGLQNDFVLKNYPHLRLLYCLQVFLKFAQLVYKYCFKMHYKQTDF